jgi:hypothetical protein
MRSSLGRSSNPERRIDYFIYLSKNLKVFSGLDDYPKKLE